jgi:hypothetical protein
MTNLLGSQNEFPIIRILEDPTPPTTPGTGVYYVYVDEATKTLHGIDDTGADIDYNPAGASIADILDLPTAETDDTLVLAPDGAGGVEFRAEAGGGGGGTYSGYTPALTAVSSNPTLGTGSNAQGRYTQDGKHVVGYASIGFGSSGVGAGSGAYRVSLPVAARAPVNFDGNLIGHAYGFDSSAGLVRHMYLSYVTGTTVQLTSTDGSAAVTEANPWAWAAGDVIIIQFDYEAA